jgi:hypothetical protein
MLLALQNETFQWLTLVLLVIILICVLPVWPRR